MNKFDDRIRTKEQNFANWSQQQQAIEGHQCLAVSGRFRNDGLTVPLTMFRLQHTLARARAWVFLFKSYPFSFKSHLTESKRLNSLQFEGEESESFEISQKEWKNVRHCLLPSSSARSMSLCIYVSLQNWAIEWAVEANNSSIINLCMCVHCNAKYKTKRHSLRLTVCPSKPAEEGNDFFLLKRKRFESSLYRVCLDLQFFSFASSSARVFVVAFCP